MRIVSLLPSATEIVFALGLEDDLAAVTFECDYPSPARDKPVVSTSSLPASESISAAEIDAAVGEKMARGEPLYTLDDELIRSIRPDLILAQDLCRVCAVPSGDVTEALDKLGCDAQVISLDPATIDDVISGIEVVGRATDRIQKADALARELRDRVDRVRTRVDGRPRPKTLALEWADPPFVGGHWIPEMVAIAGGRDALGAPGKPSERTTWAMVERAAPEVVAFMPCGYDLDGAVEQGALLSQVPELASTPAARAGRVYAVDASSFFSRPGPRIVDGLEILAWILHPDLFPTPEPGRVASLDKVAW
ncbi:MAG: cobalamin-binding protein [Actinomycetota bacterium]